MQSGNIFCWLMDFQNRDMVRALPSSCGSSWQKTATDVLRPPDRLFANAAPTHETETQLEVSILSQGVLTLVLINGYFIGAIEKLKYWISYKKHRRENKQIVFFWQQNLLCDLLICCGLTKLGSAPMNAPMAMPSLKLCRPSPIITIQATDDTLCGSGPSWLWPWCEWPPRGFIMSSGQSMWTSWCASSTNPFTSENIIIINLFRVYNHNVMLKQIVSAFLYITNIKLRQDIVLGMDEQVMVTSYPPLPLVILWLFLIAPFCTRKLYN